MAASGSGAALAVAAAGAAERPIRQAARKGTSLSFKRALLVIVGTAVATALLAALDLIGEKKLLPLIGLFAVFGGFLGLIFVTDARSGATQTDRPLLRTIVSALLGVLVSGYLGLGVLPSAAVVLVSAALGYLGMRWARYVDF